MQFINGDYISCVWVYESKDAIWTVMVVWRVLTETWEVSLTWDDFNPATDGARTSAPIHTVQLPGTVLEEEILIHVECSVRKFEIIGLSRRLAMLEIHSDDPKVLIDQFEALAMENDRFGCSIVVRDIPELGK